jgi:hypothetical protein
MCRPRRLSDTRFRLATIAYRRPRIRYSVFCSPARTSYTAPTQTPLRRAAKQKTLYLNGMLLTDARAPTCHIIYPGLTVPHGHRRTAICRKPLRPRLRPRIRPPTPASGFCTSVGVIRVYAGLPAGCCGALVRRLRDLFLIGFRLVAVLPDSEAVNLFDDCAITFAAARARRLSSSVSIIN